MPCIGQGHLGGQKGTRLESCHDRLNVGQHFRTRRLRAQDVGQRDILEPIRLPDLIVVLREVSPTLAHVKER